MTTTGLTNRGTAGVFDGKRAIVTGAGGGIGRATSLLLDEASYITGADIVVDGGMTMSY